VPTPFCEAEGHIMGDDQREPLMNVINHLKSSFSELRPE
jgi:hypothetical protein